MDKIHLLLIIFISFTQITDAFDHNGRIHYQSTYACENNALDLRCEENEVIHLVRANYGRFSISICNEGGRLDYATNCMSFRSFLIMQDKCNQKSNCSVVVSSKMFGDPCPGTLKYLEVQYRCGTKGSSGSIIPPITTKKPSPGQDEIGLSSKNTVSSDMVSAKPTENKKSSSESDVSIVNKVSNDVHKNNKNIQPTLITSVNQLYSVASNSVANNNSNNAESVGSTNIVNSELLNPNLLPTLSISNSNNDNQSPLNTINSNLDFNLNNNDKLIEPKCEQSFFRSLRWPATSFDQKYSQKCPGDAIGEAHWHCSLITKTWYPERPDLTDCKSSWLSSLKDQLTQYTSNGADTALEVLKELASQTLSKQLFADDLREIDFIVSEAMMRILLRLDTNFTLTSLNTFNSQDNVMKQLLENLVEVVSNLLTNAQDDAWIDLENSVQARQIAFKLLTNLQESALVLAKTLNQDGSFSVKSQHVLVTVHVLDAEVPINLLFLALEDTRDSAWIKMEDSIFLPAKSLLDYVNNGFTKVAFFAYNRMEDLLKANSSLIANDGLPSRFNFQNQIQSNDIVNSRILSAVFVTNGKDLAKRTGKQFPLSQPIVINFKHITPIAQSDLPVIGVELHGQARCVYWNSIVGYWSAEGCWLISTNYTHTTCMCNQAGHFALQVVQSANSLTTNFSFNGIYPIFDLNLNGKDSLIYSSQLISKLSSATSAVLLLFILIILLTINGDNSELLTINRHLCFNMVITELMLTFFVFSSNQLILCSIINVLLHYFLLIILLWCFLTTLDIYLSLIDTYDTVKCANRLTWYYILTYGGSLIVLLISLIVDHNANFVNIHSAISFNHCWFSIFDYLCFTFIGPAVGVVVCSFVFLAIASFIVNNNCNNLQLIARTGLDNNKYSTGTINSSLPVVNIMSGSMFKCGSYSQTGLAGQTYVNTKEQVKYEDVRKGVRLTLVLVLVQCLTWTSGLLHVNSQQSYMLSILFSFCNIFLAIFVIIYCTARTDSIIHHRFVPHLTFYRWLRDRLARRVNSLTETNNAATLAAASLNQINQLNSAMSSLATTGSSCLTNSKSQCNIGNNYVNSVPGAPLATAATLIGQNQQNQPVVTQVATQVSGILNGNTNILPNSQTIQMGMNQLNNQSKTLSDRQSMTNQFKSTLGNNNQSKQQLYGGSNYGFTSGNIYQPLYQQNIYHPVQTNVNTNSNINFSSDALNGNLHKSSRTVAISMQAAVKNLNNFNNLTSLNNNKFNCTPTLSACPTIPQGTGNRLEFTSTNNQQQCHNGQSNSQQQQQYQQSLNQSSGQQLQSIRDQFSQFNQINQQQQKPASNQQSIKSANQQNAGQPQSFNNTRSPIYYSSR